MLYMDHCLIPHASTKWTAKVVSIFSFIPYFPLLVFGILVTNGMKETYVTGAFFKDNMVDSDQGS